MHWPPLARWWTTEQDPEKLARRAMQIAAEVCVFTNDSVTVETLTCAKPRSTLAAVSDEPDAAHMTNLSPRETVTELDRSSSVRPTPSAPSRWRCATAGGDSSWPECCATR